MTPNSPASFFQSPRLLEERKPFYNALYSQAARATAFSGVKRSPKRVQVLPPTQGNYAGRSQDFQIRGFQATAVNGLSGLGDWFTDAVKSVTTSVTDVVDTFTGRKTQVEQQQAAAALAAQRQASLLEQAKLRAVGWGKTAPWLIVGGTALGLGVLYVALKKRGG